MTIAVCSFAIVPAAGHSRRMGQPKLLLPWRGVTLIEHVLRAWTSSQVTEVLVVARRDDAPLLEILNRRNVNVISPAVDPFDMKASVQLALRYIEKTFQAKPTDCWMLAPADLPGLSAELIDHLLASYDADSPCVHAPAVEGRRAHPVLFPWEMAAAVHALGEKEGVNSLLNAAAVRDLPWHDGAILHDIDTADDYRRLEGDPR